MKYLSVILALSLCLLLIGCAPSTEPVPEDVDMGSEAENMAEGTDSSEEDLEDLDDLSDLEEFEEDLDLDDFGDFASEFGA